MYMYRKYTTEEIKYIGRKNLSMKVHSGQLYLWQERYMICCPRCSSEQVIPHIIRIVNNLPTIVPAVICDKCKAHYFVKNGAIEVLSDFV
jgi:hypothetical protein